MPARTISIDDALGRATSADHRARLAWFRSHAGADASWAEIRGHEPLLVTTAKGIFKPAGFEHALSIRQTLKSTYGDSDPVRRTNGTWLYAYHTEESGEAAQRLFTNRSLERCLHDGVPIGVLRQIREDPSEYRVLGLALVAALEGDFFYLEGFSPEGEARDGGGGATIEFALASAQNSALEQGAFDPASLYDARERIMASIVRRRGQPVFRQRLLEAYDGICAMTGCTARPALEAAYIVPYQGPLTNQVTNGLLLRADVHTLFDLALITVDEKLTVVVTSELAGTEYNQLAGRRLHLPRNPTLWPSSHALEAHRRSAGM